MSHLYIEVAEMIKKYMELALGAYHVETKFNFKFDDT